MSTTFLRNVWYAAGWASGLRKNETLPIQILNEQIVLFRDDDNVPFALMDRCPHRFAPLSKGRICNGVIECGYHGLQFNGRGACVHNPHGAIPKAAVARSYPLVEKQAMLWIWMGNPELANPSSIPDFSCNEAKDWQVAEGYLHVRSNYELENDNILDLSHIQYLHPTSLGSTKLGEGSVEVIQNGNRIWARRFIKGEVLVDVMEQRLKLEPGSVVDRWIDVRWDPPATMWLHQDVVPTGLSRPTREPITGNAHIFTPETDKTTHYWYSTCRRRSEFPEGAAEDHLKFVTGPFAEEDLPMLEAVQIRMGDADFWDLKPVLLTPDAPSVRVRRLLKKLIEDEKTSPMDSSPVEAEPSRIQTCRTS